MGFAESVTANHARLQGTGIASSPLQPSRALMLDVAPAIPGYLRDTYHWCYLNPRNVKLLDHEWVVKTILWQQHHRLLRAALAEIEPGQHVLQTACVYGDFSIALAERVGCDGKLEVFDVAEVQVQNCRRKLLGYDNAVVRHQDVASVRDELFDVVCCYFLMHEMPDEYRRRVATALLKCVQPGGKVVFVDYHKPHWAHPLKLITSLVFDTLEPFAKGLWREEIADFAGNDAGFEWRKETYFGGLFQKVVATKKG